MSRVVTSSRQVPVPFAQSQASQIARLSLETVIARFPGLLLDGFFSLNCQLSFTALAICCPGTVQVGTWSTEVTSSAWTAPQVRRCLQTLAKGIWYIASREACYLYRTLMGNPESIQRPNRSQNKLIFIIYNLYKSQTRGNFFREEKKFQRFLISNTADFSFSFFLWSWLKFIQHPLVRKKKIYIYIWWLHAFFPSLCKNRKAFRCCMNKDMEMWEEGSIWRFSNTRTRAVRFFCC